jgi:hypothetical protein
MSVLEPFAAGRNDSHIVSRGGEDVVKNNVEGLDTA